MSIPKEVLQKYEKAGKIAREVREEAKNFVHEDMPLVDICERVESLIAKKGGKPAFPCNVSVNEIAAHYTSPPLDKQVIPRGSIVKVDIGVHIDGYIGDTAVTVCFSQEQKNLVDTAKKALQTAVKILRPGLSFSGFGSTIEKVIRDNGLKPISNLTGHQVGRYLIHAGKSLPNVSHFSISRISEGEIYAVEPFVTVADAAGRVGSSSEAYIFRFLKQKTLRNPCAKQLLDFIKENFFTLPFAERWLQGAVPSKHFREAFSELISSRSLMSYPVFIEASRKPVAQAEHTVLIEKNGCRVLT
jgi:methionyl aminopeptidase